MTRRRAKHIYEQELREATTVEQREWAQAKLMVRLALMKS